MIEAVSLPFMQRALLAGVLVGIMTSYLGVFVVQRRLSFLGSGLAHAALGGVALGIFLGLEPLAIAVPFTVVIALGIGWLQSRTAIAGDTAIGVLFSLSVALGVILLALKGSYTSSAFTYLFGSVLAVGPADLEAAAVLFILVLASLLIWGRWAYATFDRDLAMADRVRVERDDQIFSALVAAVVVVALKVVGLLLVAAVLVIPAASARLLSRTLFQMTLISVTLGVLGMLGGILLAYQLDIPSGATVIVVEGGIFVLSLLAARLKS